MFFENHELFASTHESLESIQTQLHNGVNTIWYSIQTKAADNAPYFSSY